MILETLTLLVVAAPPAPASRTPTTHFRIGGGVGGQLTPIPAAPAATENWRGQSALAGGWRAHLGVARVEGYAGVSFGQKTLTRRRALGGLTADDGGLDVSGRFGANVDLDGLGDGLGWMLGLGFGVRSEGGRASRDLTDSRCTDCPAVRDYQIRDSIRTFAAVPSLTYRAPIIDDGFRMTFDVELAAWLGARHHRLSFTGESTAQSEQAYLLSEAGKASGFYAGMTVGVGVNFGYAAETKVESPLDRRTKSLRKRRR